MKSSIKLLILIGIIAFIFRFLFLGSNPPSLTWDEVALGYNAYSLGIDGKDEFGKFMPLDYIESFGDFKPPAYAYLAVIPVKVLGLNEFSTRFPSAFFGLATVLLTYFLVLQIFGTEKKKEALVAAFLVAISPWHIMLSRAAFEANVATFFIAFGTYLFLKSMNHKLLFMIPSVVSFVISLYTFNSARVIVPIIVLLFLTLFFRKLIKNLRVTLLSALLGFLLSIPLLIFLASPQAKLRFNEVNIFSDISVIHRTNQEIQNDNNSIVSRIIHNRRFAYGVEYVRHYFDNLTPKYLFISGDGNPKFSIQDVGQLYLWEVPFLVGGILLIFRRRIKHWWIVPAMIAIALIPAGFARETPHALRTENAIPYFQVITAFGVVAFYNYVKQKRAYVITMTLSIVLGVAYFSQNLFFHYPQDYSGEWQYGYKEAITYVGDVQDKYDKVYTTGTLGRPYIYYLQYMKVSPSEFRRDSDVFREALGFVHVTRFSKYYFPENISQIREKNSLYISSPGEVPEAAIILKKFNLLNGKEALVAYTL